MSSSLVLHSYWRSSCSFRVRIALHLKGLSFETRPVHLVKDGGRQFDAEFTALNPMQQVPALSVVPAGGAAPTTITQSVAIMEYLEDAHPAVPLLPASHEHRAWVRQLVETVASGTQPIQNLAVIRKHAALCPEVDGAGPAWATHWITLGLDALETMANAPPPGVSAPKPGEFLAGAQPSIADCCLVPQLFNARRFEVDLQRYPTLLAVEKVCLEHPAFVAALPENQIDAEA